MRTLVLAKYFSLIKMEKCTQTLTDIPMLQSQHASLRYMSAA